MILSTVRMVAINPTVMLCRIRWKMAIAITAAVLTVIGHVLSVMIHWIRWWRCALCIRVVIVRRIRRIEKSIR